MKYIAGGLCSFLVKSCPESSIGCCTIRTSCINNGNNEIWSNTFRLFMSSFSHSIKQSLHLGIILLEINHILYSQSLLNMTQIR